MRTTIYINQEPQYYIDVHSGLRLWSLDLKTGQAQPIATEEELHIEEGHIYTVALNARNAQRKFKKMIEKL